VFMDAAVEGMRAFSASKAGPVAGHLLLALVDIAAGVVALVWPSPTALALTLLVGIWAVVGGCLEIFAAFASGQGAGHRALLIVTGIVWVAFGAILFSRPDIGAVTLALVFGFFSIFTGVALIGQGIELRRTANTLHTIQPTAKAA
jgi:uncharacterized membrane protein HdeD (DUF308 family)